MKGAEGLMNDVRSLVLRIVDGHDLKNLETWGLVRNKIRDDVGLLLFKKTEKRPMVLPVILKV